MLPLFLYTSKYAPAYGIDISTRYSILLYGFFLILRTALKNRSINRDGRRSKRLFPLSPILGPRVFGRTGGLSIPRDIIVRARNGQNPVVRRDRDDRAKTAVAVTNRLGGGKFSEGDNLWRSDTERG